VWSVMHGHHQDSTNVVLLLTEPSLLSEVGQGEGEQQANLISQNEPLAITMELDSTSGPSVCRKWILLVG
ncbi:MAG TPA: hypothetical protein VIY29_27345, partial [Ktedonobacteraceae bacterium]